MKNKLIFFLSIILLIACSKDDGGGEKPVVDTGVTVDYSFSTEAFTNPERGFAHTWIVGPEGDPVSTTRLANLKRENVSLILRFYYLDDFRNSPISQAQLDLIKTDFERFRAAGVKCVFRLGYTQEQEGEDAPLSIIESHLDQLKPIITENADVIAFVQAGLIGAWGEWYYSTNGLNNTEDRRTVLNKLLEVFPPEIKIQVRTPLYKQNIFNYSTAINESIGFSTDDKARVGFHNDCFLASETDQGTYQNVAVEKKFISNEALYVPTGGETCPPSGVSLASCTKAENEMKLLKWTYLNLDYYGPALQVWRTNDCYDDFDKKLGYRLALFKGKFKKEIASSEVLPLEISIRNSGFAPVYNKKKTFLIFKSGNDEYKKELAFDIRKVAPDNVALINENVSLSGIPKGQYELFLKIEDNAESLSNIPAYCIRLANQNTWDETTGYNKLLHTLTIN